MYFDWNSKKIFEKNITIIHEKNFDEKKILKLNKIEIFAQLFKVKNIDFIIN